MASERADIAMPAPAKAGSGVSASLSRRVAGPFAAAGLVGLAALALHLRDPHAEGSWGACPSLYLFGLACPLCGGMRAVNDLTNGQFVAAFWSNALFVSTIPLFGLWWLSTVRDRWLGRARPWLWPLERPGVMPAVVAVMVIFAVVRNTPWGARFYP